jgi:hypothetical protein
VKDLLRALSKEMEQAPSEIVSSLLEPGVFGAQAGREAAVVAQEIVLEEADVPYEETAVSDETKGEEEEEAVISAEEQIEEPVLSATVTGAASQEIVHAPVRTAEVATTTEPASAPQPQPEPELVSVQAGPPAAPVIDEIEESEALAGKESVREERGGDVVPQDEQATHSPEEDRANAENPEPLVEEETAGTESRPDDAVSEKVSEETFSLTADTIADTDHVEAVPSPLQEETSVPVSYELPVEEHIPEQAVSPVRLRTGETGGVKTAGAQETFAIPEQPIVQRDYESGGQASERPVADHPEVSSSERGKGKLLFAGIAALLLAALFLSGIFYRSVIVRNEQEPRTEKVAVENQKTAARPPVRKPAPVEPPKPVTAEGPVLIPNGSKVYVVKEGDTLWAISQRFTGNPFNFPQVAKNNNIKNPDLIFPGQEIRL